MDASKSAEQSCEVYADLAGTYYELKEYAEAVKWYRKATDAGVAKGAYFLAVCYELGQAASHEIRPKHSHGPNGRQSKGMATLSAALVLRISDREFLRRSDPAQGSRSGFARPLKSGQCALSIVSRH